MKSVKPLGLLSSKVSQLYIKVSRTLGYDCNSTNTCWMSRMRIMAKSLANGVLLTHAFIRQPETPQT